MGANTNIKPGDKVRWYDPAINDYDPDDRQSQLNRVWTVFHYINEDEGTLLICDDFSEAEVYLHELEKI
jgi:hypothetical protein